MINLIIGNFNKKASMSGGLCFVFMICAFAGCVTAPKTPADDSVIGLGRDSQTVVIRGLDYNVLLQLKNDALSRDELEQLFPVYRRPIDTTGMTDYEYQIAQPGTYQITDSLLTFKPDTPFKKHQVYIADFFGHSTNNNLTKMAQGKANLKGPKYTKAVFKF